MTEPAPAPVIVIVDPLGGSCRSQNPNLPHVFFDDAAVTRGDGIFETLLVDNGVPVNINRHLQRFASSAAQLELSEPDPHIWREASAVALAEWKKQSAASAVMTWTLTRGRASTGRESAWVTVSPIPRQTLTERQQGVAVITGVRGYETTVDTDVPWAVVSAKQLAYAANMSARRYARAHGADDVIFLSADGHVLEATTSTVIAVTGEVITTPAPQPGILPGTTQQALFAHAGKQGYTCRYGRLTVKDLKKADSVWLVSSVRLGARVTAIDGKKRPEPKNAATIARLISAALAADTDGAAALAGMDGDRLDKPVTSSAGLTSRQAAGGGTNTTHGGQSPDKTTTAKKKSRKKKKK
ncbi:aminodeoxychorismate lyase [Corynebacterium mendelii]|uniref:Aminodeoxychorismate lyase n=1 Tax=Corynebacterium mendelii TaxID=2765362 RepID=A0A939E1L0_9CORY|nr:aminodeoxychorismate lyase [Corynebacterium mendelii]